MSWCEGRSQSLLKGRKDEEEGRCNLSRQRKKWAKNKKHLEWNETSVWCPSSSLLFQFYSYSVLHLSFLVEIPLSVLFSYSSWKLNKLEIDLHQLKCVSRNIISRHLIHFDNRDRDSSDGEKEDACVMYYDSKRILYVESASHFLLILYWIWHRKREKEDQETESRCDDAIHFHNHCNKKRKERLWRKMA